MRTRVAVDVQVPRTAHEVFWKHGFDVVVRANPAEKDRSWFNRALKLEVQVIISPDREVQRWGKRAGIIVIDVPKNKRGGDLTCLVLKLLHRTRLQSLAPGAG
jgi:hypothetical protein